MGIWALRARPTTPVHDRERPGLYHRRVTHQIAVTGFGPFVDVERNASGEVALALADVELPGPRK